MSTLTFLNSPLLWGLSLAAIPILIHLLYRRQYRRLDWAPMRYLKLSVQRNRRRVRLEQLILLAMRVLAVVLLFLLVARPVMHAEGLGKLLGASGRVNRIVVLDDSLSMGYSEGGKTALARAQEVVNDLLSTYGPKDLFTMVLASRPQAPVVREVDLAETDELVALVRAAKPTETFVAWDTVLKAIDSLVTSGTYPLYEVTLVTDLRRSGWDGLPPELGNAWAQSHVRLRVFDVGLATTRNVSLVSLVQTDRLALAGLPTRFEAVVHNDTDADLGSLEANFIVDDKPSLVRVPPLARGETVRLPLISVFQEPGSHQVAFELPADALEGDNRRFAVVEAQASVEMLLVDGEPSAEPLGGETDFLALALSLSADGSGAFRVEVVTDSQWAAGAVSRPDLLVLANVPHLNRQQVEALERLVRSGTGLMIFVGDTVDPDNFNQWLFQAGQGLSPAALETSNETEFSGLIIEEFEDSPLASLLQLNPAALERIKIRKSYEIKLPGGQSDDVRVLARWNNTGSTPAVVQKVFGQGQVLLWTITADRAWSDWPTEPSYVLAVREAARAIARSSASMHSFSAGQPISVELAARHEISEPAIEVPGLSDPKPLVIAGDQPSGSAAGGAAATRTLTYRDTQRAGIYRISWRDSALGPQNEAFALNPDRRESELARISPEDFKRLFAALDVELVSLAQNGDASLAVRGQEIWRTLAGGLLGLLIVEACFARWAGRQR